MRSATGSWRRPGNNGRLVASKRFTFSLHALGMVPLWVRPKPDATLMATMAFDTL